MFEHSESSVMYYLRYLPVKGNRFKSLNTQQIKFIHFIFVSTYSEI